MEREAEVEKTVRLPAEKKRAVRPKMEHEGPGAKVKTKFIFGHGDREEFFLSTNGITPNIEKKPEDFSGYSGNLGFFNMESLGVLGKKRRTTLSSF